MIVLNLMDEKYPRDESTYLYVIAEIYRKHSSKKNPLKDNDVVNLMASEYGIPNVDRHIIKKYREKLRVFGYVFDEARDNETNEIMPRKGCYYCYIDESVDDETLLNICLLAKCNKSYFRGDADVLIDNISNLIASDRSRELAEEIKKIELVDNSLEESLDLSQNIRKVLLAIKKRQSITFKHNNHIRKHFWGMLKRVYPQCVFVKNDEFYMLGTSYFTKNDILVSHNYVFKFSHMSLIKPTKDSEKDMHQSKDGYLTLYSHDKSKKTVKISDLLNSLGDIEEGLLYQNYFNITETIFETDKMLLRSISDVLVNLKNKYGPNLTFTIKKVGCNDYPQTEWEEINNEIKGYFTAEIKIKAIPEEIIATSLKYMNCMTIKSPERIKKDFLSRIKVINRLVTKKYLSSK